VLILYPVRIVKIAAWLEDLLWHFAAFLFNIVLIMFLLCSYCIYYYLWRQNKSESVQW